MAVIPVATGRPHLLVLYDANLDANSRFTE